MKRNRLNGLLCGLVLGLSAAGCSVQAMAANNALSGRLAELRIYDRTAGHHLPVHWHHGKAYVVGDPGNEYEVSLANRKPGDLLAVVSVDGVNVLSGKTASSQQEGYVFSGRESYSIRGWRKSQEQTAAFYFTALPDSYAGRTGRPNNVGVIGVALFQRKLKPAAVMLRNDLPELEYRHAPLPSPAMEAEADMAQPMMQNESSNGRQAESLDRRAQKSLAAPRQRERLGTGHGRIEDASITFVEFERATREPVEVLTIHYDSYANLAARGVVPIRSSDCRMGRGRGSGQAGCSQAFPGDSQTSFVPDPPRC